MAAAHGRRHPHPYPPRYHEFNTFITTSFLHATISAVMSQSYHLHQTPSATAATDEVFLAEEQPLPTAVSPTADLPGYIADSDPEEDEEDPEEDPTDYPADGGDDDDDDDDDDEDDDDDVYEDEDDYDKEEEEH
ncbi:hypothetical protein Tco_1373915 [Tanacetum coccineum]